MTPGNEASPHSDNVRGRILTSAVKGFSQKGYAATSVRDIAQEARTTKPMLYYYFGSKEGLYSTIVSDYFDGLVRALEAGVAGTKSPEQQLRRFVDVYLDYMIAEEERGLIVLREMFGPGEKVVGEIVFAYWSRIMALLEVILAQALGAGANASLCAISIMGILNMFLLRHAVAGEGFRREEALSQVMDFFLAGAKGNVRRGSRR